MMKPESRPPVSVEDLLRFKRAERPPTEFWTRFDQELHAKQLAALVEKRPWWRSLPLAIRGLTRYHLPVGATAVLAITLISLRDTAQVTPAGADDFDSLVPVTAPVAIAALSGASADLSAEAVNALSEEPAPELALSSDASAPGELSRMVPMLPAEQLASQDERPSARSIAENRAVAEMMLGTTSSGFETRALPVRAQPQEPLTQIPNPSERRRSRFAPAFAAAAVGTSPVPTARVASRLSHEELYDSINRFGARGNSVSIKF